ncbi:MAG: cell division protein ZapA [Bryobacteraceae bacterium]|nr:cell division protein ZapA [Bryobacteraceae bacterium]MDW8380154.1 cell division protein ZapA [Bryobacterales bacterium]
MEQEGKPRRAIRVTIANQTFTLLSSGDDREVTELAHRVDDLISEIAARSANVDSSRLAILACLHLADQLQQCERNLKELREAVQSRAQKFQSLLDRMIEDIP